MTEHAWRIPVRTELELVGTWDKVNITVRAGEMQAEPDTRPESPDAGGDPEPIDDLGLCCERKMTLKQTFLSMGIYTEDVKRKAVSLLDTFVEYSKGKSVNLYVIRQFAKDMKQYADEAWRIAEKMVKEWEQKQ